jgi:hypothetical protein
MFITARRWRPRYVEAHGTTLPLDVPQPPPPDRSPRAHPVFGGSSRPRSVRLGAVA